MRGILIVTTAIVAITVSSARAQLVGQPSGQGGAPPPTPNVSTTAPSIVPNTPGTSQSQDPLLLQLQGSSSEFQSSTSPYSPSPRVRALNQLTRPSTSGDRGQAERPAGPLR
jgi:hypothetical protein